MYVWKHTALVESKNIVYIDLKIEDPYTWPAQSLLSPGSQAQFMIKLWLLLPWNEAWNKGNVESILVGLRKR